MALPPVPPYRNLFYRRHTLRQMFRLHLTDDDIEELLGRGRILEEYPDGTGFLVEGTARGRMFHAILGRIEKGNDLVVVSVFSPVSGPENSEGVEA